MKNNEALDTLHDIKDLMEKSTKFLSISGLSSILVGIYACIATGLAYSVLTTHEQINASQRVPTPHAALPYRNRRITDLPCHRVLHELLQGKKSQPKHPHGQIGSSPALEFLSPVIRRGRFLHLPDMATLLRADLFHHAHILRSGSCQLLQVHLLGYPLLGLRGNPVGTR